MLRELFNTDLVYHPVYIACGITYIFGAFIGFCTALLWKRGQETVQHSPSFHRKRAAK